MDEEQLKELKKLKQAYCQTFGTEAGALVLKHLQERCFKRHTTYQGDATEALVNEGSRKVLLTIENMMQLEIGELAKKESVT